MNRTTALSGERAELPHFAVPADLPRRLRRLSRITGAPQTYHRRKALDAYLEEQENLHGLDHVAANET